MRSHPNWIEKLVLRATHRLWNREISRILSRAYEHGYINSHEMHYLASCFDPTQDHRIAYKPERAGQWTSY